MKFWKHHEPEFDEEKFAKFIETVVLDILGDIMADLTRLTLAATIEANNETLKTTGS
jgi:hypothetical protein